MSERTPMFANAAQLHVSDTPSPEELFAWASDRRRSVLVVDDSLTNRLVIGGLLERIGFSVTSVDGGAAAVALISGGTTVPDAVLMDVSMPEVDGLRATANIRALPPPRGNVVIIGISANAMPEGRRQCIEAGMNDFLTKPAGKFDLLRTLHRCLTPADEKR
jgi:two-component system, OmpR family, response regulator